MTDDQDNCAGVTNAEAVAYVRAYELELSRAAGAVCVAIGLLLAWVPSFFATK